MPKIIFSFRANINFRNACLIQIGAICVKDGQSVGCLPLLYLRGMICVHVFTVFEVF